MLVDTITYDILWASTQRTVHDHHSELKHVGIWWRICGFNQQIWGYNVNIELEIRLAANTPLTSGVLLGKLQGKLTKLSPCGYHLRIGWRNPASSHPRTILANISAVSLCDWLSVSTCVKHINLLDAWQSMQKNQSSSITHWNIKYWTNPLK